MENIRIDLGVCTPLSVDLTDYDFNGIAKLILTVKNKPDVKAPAIIEREFTTPELHRIIITAEESLKLCPHAVYDFDKVLTDGKRYKASDNGRVILREAVGDCIE